MDIEEEPPNPLQNPKMQDTTYNMSWMLFKVWWCLGQFSKDVYNLEIFKNSPARMLSNVVFL
jgi:hypothetical protein